MTSNDAANPVQAPGSPGMGETVTGATVSDAALRDLLSGLGGDSRVLTRFIDDFSTGWTARVERLRAAVGQDDLDEAVVTLLSIHCSSTMLGAEELAGRAEAARRALRDGAPVGLVPVDSIAAIGERSRVALLAWATRLAPRAPQSTRPTRLRTAAPPAR